MSLNNGERPENCEAESSVTGSVLMVGIAIVIVNVVAVFALGLGSSGATTAPPQAGAEIGNIISPETGAGTPFDTQEVSIYHVAGDRVDTADLRIEVDVDGEKGNREAYITRIPEEGTHEIEDPAGADSYAGPDAYAKGEDPELFSYGIYGPTYIGDEWGPTMPIRFRIKKGNIELKPGDEVTVTIIHKPTDTVINKQTKEVS